MNSKLREIVARARVRSGQPNHAPAVVSTLMKDFHDELYADAAIRDMIFSLGLSQLVREVLRETQGQDAKDTMRLRAKQLELWEPEYRELLGKIDRAAVFVPSRDDHVELTPNEISTAELFEAGQYLITMGHECITRGQAIVQLAELREQGAA